MVEGEYEQTAISGNVKSEDCVLMKSKHNPRTRRLRAAEAHFNSWCYSLSSGRTTKSVN